MIESLVASGPILQAAEFPDEAVTEGPKVAWQRSGLLMLAMTLHNFPEGMADRSLDWSRWSVSIT